MRARSVLASLVAVPPLLLAGCGGSGDGGGSGKGPITLVGLWEIKGEGAAAINDYQNGAQLALERINAAGGIAGRQVKLDRVAVDQLNPQKATGQFLQAVDKEPVLMLGFPASSALLAAKSQIDRAGIPLLSLSSATATIRYGAAGGSDWLWVPAPYDDYKDQAAVRYATETLKVSKIGLLGTNESYGTTNIKGVTAAMQTRSLKPFAVRQYPPTATDLTQQVLAMKGADAVISFTYPNPLAVQLKQFEQNGLKIPTISSSSANIAVANKLVSGPVLERLYGASACDPAASTVPRNKDFAQTYKTRFGVVPTDVGAKAYDAMWIAKAAIEKAGSTDAKAIQKTLNTITITDNVVCSPKYQSDGSHFMSRHVVIDKFSADGTTTEAATYEFPALGPAKG